jgi:hypothetical protein
MGLEGVVSKRLSSPYRSGRSTDWLKIKNPEALPMGSGEGAALTWRAQSRSGRRQSPQPRAPLSNRVDANNQALAARIVRFEQAQGCLLTLFRQL